MNDLFETPELLPYNVQEVLEQFTFEEPSKQSCNLLHQKLLSCGYTFDWGLDYIPFDLRKI